MAKVDPSDLEQVIAKAGVGKRTADKMRRANEGDTTPKPSPAPRGHGAVMSAAPERIDI